MSKEAVTAFFKQVAEDESLQSRLIEFAAECGFQFTADELSEADLDNVSGGLTSAIFNTKLGGQSALGFPDVCSTPSSDGAIPTPYPNAADASSTGTSSGTAGETGTDTGATSSG